MGDEKQRPDDAEERRSVFGNLPDARPGVRSPRRDRDRSTSRGAAAPAAARPSRGARRTASSAPRRPAAPAPAEEAPAGSTRDEPAPAPERGGVEDLAWAGIAVAAEAATLGVRLLSRAMEAVRKPGDRG
jgi:hypothetical protein